MFTWPQKSLFLQPPWAPKFTSLPSSLNTKPPEVMKSQGALTKCASDCVGAAMPRASAASDAAAAAPGIHLRNMRKPPDEDESGGMLEAPCRTSSCGTWFARCRKNRKARARGPFVYPHPGPLPRERAKITSQFRDALDRS